MDDLLRIFTVAKENLTEQYKSVGISTPPTDAEVWGQLRAIAVKRKEEHELFKELDYVTRMEKRIKRIDNQLKKL